MMKRMLFAYPVLCLFAFLGTACTSSAAGDNQVAIVHMNETQFVPSSITIKKGDRLTLVDDVAVVHVIANGQWDSNGTARPEIEPGVPAVQVQFNGNDQQSIGPFNTAGTFHLYCTVHDDMNLLVIVTP